VGLKIIFACEAFPSYGEAIHGVWNEDKLSSAQETCRTPPVKRVTAPEIKFHSNIRFSNNSVMGLPEPYFFHYFYRKSGPILSLDYRCYGDNLELHSKINRCS
jgi:hypothetical protein